MCWGSHILFQSHNGAHVLWPRWANAFSCEHKWILGTVETVSISPGRWTTKAWKCWSGVWEQRMRRPLWEIHLWSCSDALNANYETQKRSETKRHATDSTIHHAMLFDLKRLFFINNFVIVGAAPTGENMLPSFSPPASQGGQRSVVQCLAHRHFRRRDA